MKRFRNALAWLLLLSMVFGLLGTGVFAADASNDGDAPAADIPMVVPVIDDAEPDAEPAAPAAVSEDLIADETPQKNDDNEHKYNHIEISVEFDILNTVIRYNADGTLLDSDTVPSTGSLVTIQSATVNLVGGGTIAPHAIDLNKRIDGYYTIQFNDHFTPSQVASIDFLVSIPDGNGSSKTVTLSLSAEEVAKGAQDSRDQLLFTLTYERTVKIYGAKITVEKYVDGVKADSSYDGAFTFTVGKDSQSIKDGVAVFYLNYNLNDVVKPIEYTISEAAATGYTNMTGTASSTVAFTASTDASGALVYKAAASPATVKFDNASNIDIDVTKKWDDADDQDGKRPDNVVVNLLANGEATGKTLTISEAADGSWTGTFENLPKYENGKEIAYTITENDVADYTPAISGNAADGFVVTNTHEPETAPITVTKEWDDADNQDGIRPGSVTVYVLADGEQVAELTLDASGRWTGTTEELPVYAAGEAIEYSVEEKAVEGYEPEISGDVENGFVVANTHEPEVISINLVKVWVDNNDKKEARPDSISVQVYANGEKYGDPITLNEAGQWKATVEDLPKYDGGKEIKYTVKENGIKYYVAKYETKDNTITISNTYIDIPITGDSMNIMFWMLLGLGCCGILALVGLRIRRRA